MDKFFNIVDKTAISSSEIDGTKLRGFLAKAPI